MTYELKTGRCWLAESELYDDNGDPVEGLFDALYVAFRRITIYVEVADRKKAMAQMEHHDMQFRECALRIAKELAGCVKMDDVLLSLIHI